MVDYNRSRMSLPTYDAWPRWVNLLIGIWLIISAFAWYHTAGAQTNTWIVGALIAIASIWAMFAPSARFLNTIFAIWLFFATLVIHHGSTATVWNNLIAAVVVFVLSLIPSPPTRARTRGQRPLHAA